MNIDLKDNQESYSCCDIILYIYDTILYNEISKGFYRIYINSYK